VAHVVIASVGFLSDPHWDPLWATAQDRELPISFHIGSGDFEKDFSPERIRSQGFPTAYARVSANLFLGNGFHLTELLLSGVLARFPDLQVVSVESGIGWVPFMLEALDHQFHEAGLAYARPDLELLPPAPNPHLAFGHGEHYCIGQALARLEIRVLFEELLTRLRNIEIIGPVQLLATNFVGGIKHLPIRATVV